MLIIYRYFFGAKFKYNADFFPHSHGVCGGKQNEKSALYCLKKHLKAKVMLKRIWIKFQQQKIFKEIIW